MIRGKLTEVVRRIVCPSGSVCRIWRGPLAGWRFESAPGMGSNYMLGGSHYPFAQLASVLRPGMTVYDIGANRGQMALFFSKSVGAKGRVVAFEPVSELVDQLRRNLELNAAGNVEIVSVALGREDGTASFCFRPEASTQGYLRDRAAEANAASLDERTVEVRALDGFSALPEPDLLKVDVEGGGYEALLGARETLARARPRIYFELHGRREREAVLWCQSELGYRVADSSLQPVSDFSKYWQNVVWLLPK